MKILSKSFKPWLYRAIEDIEDSSSVQLEVIIKQQSAIYRNAAFIAATVFMCLTYLYFIFSSTVLDIYLIYAFTIIAFVTGYVFFEYVKPLKRYLISKKLKYKTTKRYAKTFLQKKDGSQIKNEAKILIYISVFEQKVIILADKNVEKSIPKLVWEKIKFDFQNIFKARDISIALLEQLYYSKQVFLKYLPLVENKVYELTDNVKSRIRISSPENYITVFS